METAPAVIIREQISKKLNSGESVMISESTCAKFAPSIPVAIEWCKYKIRKLYPNQQLSTPVLTQWWIDDVHEKDLRVYIKVWIENFAYTFSLIPRDRMSVHKMGKLKMRSLVTASTIAPGLLFTPDVIDDYPDIWIDDATLRIMNRLRNTDAHGDIALRKEAIKC